MTNTLVMVDVCQHCGDSGWVRIVEKLAPGYNSTGELMVMPPDMTDIDIQFAYPYPKFALTVMECPCVTRKRAMVKIQRLVDDGHIDADVMSYTFADFRDKQYSFNAGRLAVQLTEGDVVSDGQSKKYGVMISGNNGCGKSSMAYVVFKARVERGQGAAWMNWNKLLEDIRWTYEADYRGKPKADMIAPALSAAFLVIDDLGDPSRGDRQLAGDGIEALRTIVEVRYNKHMPTIITTNLTEDQLVAQFSARDMSRVNGLCHFVTMNGKDMRAAR